MLIATFAAALAVLPIAGAPPQQPQVAKSSTILAQSANRHYTLGWNAARAQNWPEAVREFQSAIGDDPDFALAYYSLGRAHMGQKDFPSAITAYLKCRELYTTATGQQFTNQLDARQRLEERIQQYRNAINQARSSGGGTAASNQSQSLYVRQLQTDLMRLEQARDHNTNSVTFDSKVPYFVPMSLGAAYFRNGAFANAETEYKLALEANPDSGETHNNLAVLYLTIGKIADAEAEVKAAEKTGFKVNENLKSDILQKKRAG